METTGSPMDNVLMVFGALLALALVRTLPDLVKFYAEFSASGLEMAKHRGYGQSACKFYGAAPSHRARVRVGG